MFPSLTRGFRGFGSVTAAALLLGAGVSGADAALICWTGSNGVRHCQSVAISCDTFFGYFGHIIDDHPEWGTRCYNVASSTNVMPVCESCVMNYAPGIDGAALLGATPGPVQDDVHYFILHDSGARQVFIRRSGGGGGAGGLFVADLPSPPSFGPGTSTYVHVHQGPDPRTWLPFPPFGLLPPAPVVGSDFVLHFGAIDDLSGTLFFQQEIALNFNQLVFRPIPPACPADFDRNGSVNTNDLTALLGNFGSVVTPFTAGDCNGDGIVNTQDLVIFLAGFGSSCPTP